MLRGLMLVMLTLLVGQNKWDYLDYIRVQPITLKILVQKSSRRSSACVFDSIIK